MMICMTISHEKYVDRNCIVGARKTTVMVSSECVSKSLKVRIAKATFQVISFAI